MDAAAFELVEIVQVMQQLSSVTATKRLCRVLHFGGDLLLYTNRNFAWVLIESRQKYSNSEVIAGILQGISRRFPATLSKFCENRFISL